MARFKNGVTDQLEKDFGACPWGNTNVTSACEDERWQFDCRHAGRRAFSGSTRTEIISTSRQNRDCPPSLSFPLCLDREGNLWAGTDGGGLNRIKRKIFNAPDGLHPFDRAIRFRGRKRRIVDGLQRAGVSYWNTNSAQDFGVGQYSKCVDGAGGSTSSKFGSEPATKDCFNFRPIILFPRPARKFLARRFSRLFEDRSGQLWAGTQNGLANFDGQKWKLFTTRDGLSENSVRAIAQDTDGNFWIGTENRGLNFFKDGKFISYSKIGGKRFARQRHLLPLRGQRRRFVGRNFRPRTGAISKWKMDALFDGRRPRQRQHQLHHRGRRR